jgi:CheY-like chemotaxis protein
MKLPPLGKKASALGGLRLLLIEDEPDTRELLLFVFEMEGAEVETVETMQEAFGVLRQTQPDVILSNVNLPDGNGYVFIHEWRKLEVKQGQTFIPAIAVTAADRAVNEPLAIAAGFQSFVQKPIEPELLVAIVVDVIKRKDDFEVLPIIIDEKVIESTLASDNTWLT